MKREAVAVRLALVVVGLAHVAGCSGECCLVDLTSSAVLQGTVTGPAGAVEAAQIRPASLLSYDCSVTTNPLHAEPEPALTDSTGRFRLTLISADGPGTHCFDLEVVRETNPPDTVSGVRAEFRLISGASGSPAIVDIVLDS